MPYPFRDLAELTVRSVVDSNRIDDDLAILPPIDTGLIAVRHASRPVLGVRLELRCRGQAGVDSGAGCRAGSERRAGSDQRTAQWRKFHEVFVSSGNYTERHGLPETT